MKENRKTDAGRVGGSSPSSKVAEARRGRWLRIASKIVSEQRENPNAIPPAWFEEIEGRPLEEAVVDLLAVKRGVAGGARRGSEKKMILEEDAEYERRGGRSLAANDLEVVKFAVHDFTDPVINFALGRAERRAFVRKFYKAGDDGLMDAQRRALRYAVGVPMEKHWRFDPANFDGVDGETLRRLAKKNGVSCDEVILYISDMVNGRRRRGSRRLDLSV